jgi:predicted amidohydrolase
LAFRGLRGRPLVKETLTVNKKTETVDTSKRKLLAGAGAVGLTAALAGGPSAAQAQVPSAGRGTDYSDVKVARNGRYETVPLRQDSINVTAIQSHVRAVDIRDLRRTMKANLDHIIKLIDNAQGSSMDWGGERLWGSKQDLLCMHEFPLQGFQPWTREQLLRVAIDLPGPETEAIGERAKRYGCYISFGAYAREKDWPRHVINMSILMGPDGSIVSKQWKGRNILGLFGEGALIGTTVYDVLDRYVEMYGWDATLPVARTDIGNIAITAVGAEPLLYQCLALKGAEILVLSVTGGSNAESAKQVARSNRIYTVGIGNAVTPDNIGWADAAGVRGDGSLIADPRGESMAQTANHHEDFASARIPIADFRKTRRFPEVPSALLLPVLQQYEPKFKPNAFLDKVPETYKEAGEMVRAKMGS